MVLVLAARIRPEAINERQESLQDNKSWTSPCGGITLVDQDTLLELQ